ncbi:MAG: TauD/TfdA dioxygenase family protein [Hyphomicrobiaceae bacterium]
MTKQDFQIEPIAGALGAEISGVDLRSLSDATLQFVRGTIHRYLVVFFRDQELPPDDHLQLTRRFGPVGAVPHASRLLSGFDEILEVRNKADAGRSRNVGGSWHTDMPFQETPPSYCILYGKDVPSYGGDTLWSNLQAPYEALSDGLRASLDGMRAIHSATRIAGSKHKGPIERQIKAPLGEMDREVDHPVVRTHTESSRKCLYVNASTFIRFVGWSEDESAPLHDYLCRFVTRPEFTCRLRWTPNTVAIWDNRCTQHYAVDDYGAAPRNMYRTVVAGERPI